MIWKQFVINDYYLNNPEMDRIERAFKVQNVG